jgi:hypothetical protein
MGFAQARAAFGDAGPDACEVRTSAGRVEPAPRAPRAGCGCGVPRRTPIRSWVKASRAHGIAPTISTGHNWDTERPFRCAMMPSLSTCRAHSRIDRKSGS